VAVTTWWTMPRTRSTAGVLAPAHTASTKSRPGQLARGPVPLRAPTWPHLHRQPGRLEPPEQGPTCGVQRRCIFERTFGLCLHLRMAELRRVSGALLQVAGLTRQGQVADAVAATSGPGHDMLDLQGHTSLVAGGAAPLPLFQQELPPPRRRNVNPRLLMEPTALRPSLEAGTLQAFVATASESPSPWRG
jgi:hypothetical protein